MHAAPPSQYIGYPQTGSATAQHLAAGGTGPRQKKEIKRRTKTGCLTCRKRRIKVRLYRPSEPRTHYNHHAASHLRSCQSAIALSSRLVVGVMTLTDRSFYFNVIFALRRQQARLTFIFSSATKLILVVETVKRASVSAWATIRSSDNSSHFRCSASPH